MAVAPNLEFAKNSYYKRYILVGVLWQLHQIWTLQKIATIGGIFWWVLLCKEFQLEGIFWGLFCGSCPKLIFRWVFYGHLEGFMAIALDLCRRCIKMGFFEAVVSRKGPDTVRSLSAGQQT